MDKKILDKTQTLENLPSEWSVSLLPDIQQELSSNPRKIVVLDDDPTGTQTVYDIPVLTEWPVEALKRELVDPAPTFYLLTNSRSLPLVKAQTLNAEIGQNLVEAAHQTGREVVVVSRSDSTLRGHFPGEVEALAQSLNQKFDGWLLIPYFLEGGRYTINDIHYVAEGDQLIPAAETPFAKDAAFGYRASNLKEWVAEKTWGRTAAEAVQSISINEIRRGGPHHVTERLIDLSDQSVCVINAAGPRDMEVFVNGLLQAEAQGKRFLYRTAASFVQTRSGLGHQPLLTPADLELSGQGGGLVVVGSYVPKTTAQVDALKTMTDIHSLEIKVDHLLHDDRRADEIERAATLVDQILSRGQDVLIYTSRQLVTGNDAEKSLAIGRRVSESLVEIVRAISTRSRYLLAKGGITASDIATQGLGIKRAMVRGQILPGVPVWQAGPESRHPGLAYIVFPGNVGGPDALAQIVMTLKK